MITSRSHPRFLGHKSSLGPHGEIMVDGLPWDSPEIAAQVVDVAGPGAKLVRSDGAERFDVLPLLVATGGAITAFGHDRRRLRPNIVIGGVEGLTEGEWPGAWLRIVTGAVSERPGHQLPGSLTSESVTWGDGAGRPWPACGR